MNEFFMVVVVVVVCWRYCCCCFAQWRGCLLGVVFLLFGFSCRDPKKADTREQDTAKLSDSSRSARFDQIVYSAAGVKRSL